MITQKNEHILELLITRALEGDEIAFSRIYNMIKDKMYRLCLKYNKGSREDANECFQEGCINLYRGLGTFKNDGSFEGWVRRIFFNCCMSYIRRNKHSFFEIGDEAEQIAEKAPSSLDILYMNDILSVINKRLPNDRHLIFKLYLIDGYSQVDISKKLGLTETATKSQIYRARLNLQKHVKRN